MQNRLSKKSKFSYSTMLAMISIGMNLLPKKAEAFESEQVTDENDARNTCIALAFIVLMFAGWVLFLRQTARFALMLATLPSRLFTSDYKRFNWSLETNEITGRSDHFSTDRITIEIPDQTITGIRFR